VNGSSFWHLSCVPLSRFCVILASVPYIPSIIFWRFEPLTRLGRPEALFHCPLMKTHKNISSASNVNNRIHCLTVLFLNVGKPGLSYWISHAKYLVASNGGDLIKSVTGSFLHELRGPLTLSVALAHDTTSRIFCMSFVPITDLISVRL